MSVQKATPSLGNCISSKISSAIFSYNVLTTPWGSFKLSLKNCTTQFLNTTFYGAWNLTLDYLIKNYPFAHIGIIVSNGCETDDYRVATIAVAKNLVFHILT